MYITAQRVATLENTEGCINTYLYLHGPESWDECPIPEENPGALERKLITLDPNQNLIVSYLDLVFPDDAQFPWLSAEQPYKQWVKGKHSMQRFVYDAQIEREGTGSEAVLLYSQCKAVWDSYQAVKLMGHAKSTSG